MPLRLLFLCERSVFMSHHERPEGNGIVLAMKLSLNKAATSGRAARPPFCLALAIAQNRRK